MAVAVTRSVVTLSDLRSSEGPCIGRPSAPSLSISLKESLMHPSIRVEEQAVAGCFFIPPVWNAGGGEASRSKTGNY
jgi:hypothetical protein